MSCDISQPGLGNPCPTNQRDSILWGSPPQLDRLARIFCQPEVSFFRAIPTATFPTQLQSRNTPLKKSQPVFRIAFWFANHHQKQHSTHLSTPRHSVRSHLPRMWWQRPWPLRHKTQPMRSIPSRVLPTTR